MATQKRPRTTAAKRSGAANTRQRASEVRVPVLPVVIGGIVVLVIVAIVAAALSGGKNKSSDNGVPQTRSVAVTGAPLPAFQNTQGDKGVGKQAPTIAGQNFAGQPVKIFNDGHAKAVIFVAHWCPHCQREVPNIANYLHTAGLPTGVELFMVPTDTNPNRDNYPPSTWLAREGLANVPTVVDDGHSTAFGAYGGSTFPYFVLLDKQNRVLLRVTGEIGAAAYPQIFQALAQNKSPIESSGAASPSQ